MMTEEEGWLTYGLEAVELVLQQGIVCMQTVQGSIRIMKLISHEHVLQHCTLKTVKYNREATLELLMDLMLKADLSEYQDILGYLHCWKEEHESFLHKQLFSKKFHKFTFLVKYPTLLNKSVHCSYCSIAPIPYSKISY